MRVSFLCFIASEGECNGSEVEGGRGGRVPLGPEANRWCSILKKNSFVNLIKTKKEFCKLVLLTGYRGPH